MELDRTDFLTGPLIYLQNPFRLTQMPVEAADRKLTQRQKAIETARAMELDLPAGPCAIFAGEAPADALQDALHRMRDPAVRLFAEIFWFWPKAFSAPDDGAADLDAGLRMLAEDRIPEAIQLWESGEKARDVVSTHNLAVLHHFLAVRADDNLIATETPLRIAPSTPAGSKLLPSVKKGLLKLYHRNSPEEEARRHWSEALRRWKQLSTHEPFWRLVEARISRIGSPQLPLEAASWFQQHIVAIVHSINAVLMLQAAERTLTDHVERQRQILKASGFDEAQLDDVLEALTVKERSFLKTASEEALARAQGNPRQGHVAARALAGQAHPILGVLRGAYPPGLAKILDTLHDNVAETILRCELAYGGKTEDWPTCEELDRLAESFARGESTLEWVRRELKQTLERKESGDDWCVPGYFALPEPCVEALERARNYRNVGVQGIDLLRECLLGLADLTAPPEFRQFVLHCLAFCFKSRGVAEYNSALEKFNHQHRQVLQGRMRIKVPVHAIANRPQVCCRCANPIFDPSYYQREIEGVTYAFCNSCNGAITSAFEALEKELDVTRQSSLDFLTLANALDPGYKGASRNLTIIRENCSGRNIKAATLHDLKVQWKLFIAEETIELLAGGKHAAPPLFTNLAWIVSRQPEAERRETLAVFFSKATKSREKFSPILALLLNDAYIFAEFVRQVLANAQAEGRSVAVSLIMATEDYSLRFAIVDELKRYPDADAKELRESLLESFASLAERFGATEPLGTFSLTSGRVGGLLSRAAGYGLENGLIGALADGVAESKAKGVMENLLRQIESHRGAQDWFYRDLFGAERSSRTRSAVIESLAGTDNEVLMMKALARIRSASRDAPALEAMDRIERAARARVEELTRQEIGKDPGLWFTGRIGALMREAASYDPEFECRLFAAVVAAGSGGESLALNVMQALTARVNDRQLFLDVVAGTYPGLDPESQLTFHRVMMRHWDAAIRGAGLRGIERFADTVISTLFAIQALADSDASIRQAARAMLESRPDECCGPAFEAIFSETSGQLNELESLLGGIESRLSPEAAPSLETLIRRLALIDDQAISSRLLSFLDRYHSGWQDQGRRSIRACLAWLKCVAVESRASGRSSLPSVVASTQLLEAYRSRSFMNKMAVWMIRPVRPEAGFAERWWEQSLVAALPAPAESGPGPKRPRGADLAGRIQAGAGSQQSLRK